MLSRSRERDLLDVDRHRARLDLGQVQDVVDQASRSLPEELMLREYSTCLGATGCRSRSRPAAATGSGSSSAACAARATCWPGTRTCTWRTAPASGLFLQRAAGLLHLGVLALHFAVLFGQQAGLGAQFLVGLLQLDLARLQRAAATASAGDSVRIVASMVLNTAPMPISWSRKFRLVCVKGAARPARPPPWSASRTAPAARR
jgi:hypothetical protein